MLWVKYLLCLYCLWFIPYVFTTWYFKSFHNLVFVLAWSKKFQTKTFKNQFLFIYFEIVLACSYGSLGTISSTNIFGAVAGDETEAYLPWDIIIHLILRGEQNQKIF